MSTKTDRDLVFFFGFESTRLARQLHQERTKASESHLRVKFLLKSDSGYPRDTVQFGSVQSHLRVEFLLKTDGGYPRDAEVT